MCVFSYDPTGSGTPSPISIPKIPTTHNPYDLYAPGRWLVLRLLSQVSRFQAASPPLARSLRKPGCFGDAVGRFLPLTSSVAECAPTTPPPPAAACPRTSRRHLLSLDLRPACQPPVITSALIAAWSWSPTLAPPSTHPRRQNPLPRLAWPLTSHSSRPRQPSPTRHRRWAHQAEGEKA
jgi:hypothetical protein